MCNNNKFIFDINLHYLDINLILSPNTFAFNLGHYRLYCFFTGIPADKTNHEICGISGKIESKLSGITIMRSTSYSPTYKTTITSTFHLRKFKKVFLKTYNLGHWP